jgi:predicted ester cyclase
MTMLYTVSWIWTSDNFPSPTFVNKSEELQRASPGGITTMGERLKTAGEAEKGKQIVSEEDENKALLRRLLEAYNTGNMAVVDELFVPELAERAKQGFTAYRSAFPDWCEEIVDVVAEGDKVVGRFKCSGTHRGEMTGIPPTGRHMEVDEVYFLRVENGKFVEFWGLEDNLTRMRQLGLLPPRPGVVLRVATYYAKKLRSKLPRGG